MMYTTGWTRKAVGNPLAYAEWLSEIKDYDHVLFQQFYPAASEGAALDFPHERWKFERVKVLGNQLISCGNSYPFNRYAGTGCYWNTGDEWGNVFPARIVPVHSDLPANSIGESVYGHRPVFEPFYFGCYRHHAFIEYGPCHGYSQPYERYYKREVEGGDLLIFFSDHDPETAAGNLPEHINYLYAEHLQP